jgi:phosphoglycolate phosphatase-like HAD superfamily hydrolase
VKRLILWDIDGTLVRTGVVGREALEIGAATVAQLDEIPHVDMGGKTDPQIVREIFTLADLADDHIERLLPAALVEVERALARTKDRVISDGAVMPGVREVLTRLAVVDGVRQTLLTGNVVANAALKLSAFGLDGCLDVEAGAYGTDHEDRTQLVPIARARVEELRGERYADDEIWIIGDTVHDLTCARAGGVRCLLVGTGSQGWDGVRDLGADAALSDLSDVDQVVTILLGITAPPSER